MLKFHSVILRLLLSSLLFLAGFSAGNVVDAEPSVTNYTDSASGDQTTGYPKVVFTDADNKTTTTETNRNGQTRFYTNKKNKVFEFCYDSLGRRTHVISPLDAENNRAHTTAYTHRGPPSLITEPSGDSAAFSYNSTTGRLDTLTYAGAGGSTVLYNHTDSYDTNGNVKHLSEGSQHIHRSYDSHNRVSTHTDANGNQIGYIYYPSGKIAKIIYPSGTENGTGHVEYTYWKTGRLKNVIDKLDSTTSPRVSTYHWNIDGKLARIERPNGTSREITYDAYGRPAMVQEATSDGSALIHLSKHGYYDSDEMQWNYTLPKSPPIQRVPLAPITSATYRSDNSLDQFNGSSVSHDADGNLTSVQGSVGVPPASYSYDSRNRLLTAGATTYTYGPEGSRLTNSENGGTTYVTEANLGLSKILQRTKNGVTTRYVWGAGLLYEVDAAGATTTYHYNSSGSTIALTNDAKEVIERMDYSPFGQTIYRESLDGDTDLHDTPFLFTGFFGNQTDANGLIYMRARYYNPLLRRFLNVDPAREGWNWYGYAGGNPMAFVDPTGLGISSVLDAVQTALGFLGMIPVVGNIFDAVNVGISLGRGNYGEAMLAAASAIPGAGLAAGGVGIFARTSRGALRSSSRSLFSGSRSVGKFDVGPYNQMRGQVPGLDAHHVGQKAVMKNLIPGYNPNTAPSILVPQVGHTISKEGVGVVSRSTRGFTSPRQVLARDIREMRRVYPDVPNSKLQELIRQNKQMYSNSLRK